MIAEIKLSELAHEYDGIDDGGGCSSNSNRKCLPEVSSKALVRYPRLK